MRRWEVGVLYGDFGGANAISTYGSYSFTPNLSGEVWVTQVLGRFSDSTAANLNIVHVMYPEWRASPYFTLGAGDDPHVAEGDARLDDRPDGFDGARGLRRAHLSHSTIRVSGGVQNPRGVHEP